MSPFSYYLGYKTYSDVYYNMNQYNSLNYDQNYIMFTTSCAIKNYNIFLNISDSHLLSKERGVTSLFTGVNIRL